MKKRKLLKKEIWKKRGRKGFSLGEVLLTVAILGILAAIAVPSIGYFSRLLNQMKLDNTAREIFISAQNKMVTMKSCGMELPKGNSMGLTAPADYDETTMGTWANQGTDESIHPFRYISAADAAFMEDTLLGKNRQEGEYVIEFNRNTGNVYAVFYWEPQEVDFGGKSSFVYASENNTHTEGDKTYRIRQDKKERMNSGLKVGYYGGNVAAMTDAKELVYDAQIINADELQLRLMPADEEIGAHTRYVITIRSATDTENEAEYTFGVQYDGVTTPQSVTFEATGAAKVSGELPINIEKVNDVSKKECGFLITLDSVEKGKHFANLFPKIAAGDDISIKVQAYYLGTDQVYIAKQNYELTDNSLFARVRQDSAEKGGKINPQGTDVVITTGRHLQNLSEEASHLGYMTDKNNAMAETKTKYPIVNAKLNANIDWTDGDYDYSEKNTLYNGKDPLESFQPINISKDNVARVFDGNGRTISNLSITEPAKSGSVTAAGLFGIVQDDLTIQNLKLKDCTVNTTDVNDTGMLVGRIDMNTTSQTVSIQNCGVLLDKTEYTETEYQVENVAETNQSSNVGGFVGNMGYGSLKIQDSFSAVNVRAKEDGASSAANAGGFVGLASGKVSIENSYTSCKADAEGKTGACAGGLVGKITSGNITASNCFTTCDVSAKTNYNKKGYAGGAFGNLNCDITLTDMQSYGLVSLQGGDSFSRAGGFIGKMGTATNSVKCTNCSYLSMQDYNNSGSIDTSYDALYAPSSSYDAMLKGTDANKKLTFAYLEDLKDKPFPFALMQKKDSTENLPYYGNWPKPTEETESVVGLCYYEKYGENDYGVFISGVDTEKGGAASVYTDTLIYDAASTKRVQKSGYCIAAKGKGVTALNGYTRLTSLPSLAGYQFYQLPDGTPNTAGVCNVSLNGKTFYYQPDFAAAISVNAGKYASAFAAYQVRTEEQLAKVGAYKGYTFHQTMNIDIDTIDGTSLIAEFPATTTLDGKGSHFDGKTEVSPATSYTITMATENGGLIGTNQGTLRNLVLEGQNDNGDFLVVQNEGTMENCIANHADVVKQDAENP